MRPQHALARPDIEEIDTMTWERPWSINNGKWWYPPDLIKPAVRATPLLPRVTATHFRPFCPWNAPGARSKGGQEATGIPARGLAHVLRGSPAAGEPLQRQLHDRTGIPVVSPLPPHGTADPADNPTGLLPPLGTISSSRIRFLSPVASLWLLTFPLKPRRCTRPRSPSVHPPDALLVRSGARSRSFRTILTLTRTPTLTSPSPSPSP